MNFSRFHVLRIQETDYRPHLKCGGIRYFLKHYKHSTMRKHSSIVCKLRPCLATESTNSARMGTVVTAALQRQYSQMELIFWITLVFIIPRLTVREILYCVCTWDHMCIWVWMNSSHAAMYQSVNDSLVVAVNRYRHKRPRHGRHSIVRLESRSPSDTTSAYVWLCAV